MIPLLKDIHPASLQPGSPRPEAEGDGLLRRGRVPEKPPGLTLSITFGRCPGMASCSERSLQPTGLGKKPKNQDKSRLERTLGVQPSTHTKEHFRVRPRCSGPYNCLVHGAAVPVAGDSAPAVQYRGTAGVHTHTRLQTQQKCVIYTV